MTLTYMFNGEEFEFDITYSKVVDYVESLSAEEAIELVKDCFYELEKDIQHEILNEVEEPNFACPDFGKWIADDVGFCVDEIIMEPDNLYRLEDELHDFYEDEAYNNYKDSTMNPYEEIGMNPSDFF